MGYVAFHDRRKGGRTAERKPARYGPSRTRPSLPSRRWAGRSRAIPKCNPGCGNGRPAAVGAVFCRRGPVRFTFWDGSTSGTESSLGRVLVHSPTALTRLMWSPNELGMARAFVAGDIDIDGDLYGVLMALHSNATVTTRTSPRAVTSAVSVALRLGAAGPPPKRPPEEVHLSGWRHSKGRDAAAIRHHYDVGDDFYRLVLGPAMTYSCARFEPGQTSLEMAQRSKHDLICRKLGLADGPDKRLLDVGCGWGSMAIHATREYRAKAVAITLSPSQAKSARQRTREAGVGERIDVRLQDYRDFGARRSTPSRRSACSSTSAGGAWASTSRSSLPCWCPEGGCSTTLFPSRAGRNFKGATFMNRYVFPDGELIDVADVVRGMERVGFEVRDVESLREHYTRTLRAWVANLEGAWDSAVKMVGERRARVWRLYMAASANAFDEGAIAVHQVLGVRPTAGGASLMPPTRAGWG